MRMSSRSFDFVTPATPRASPDFRTSPPYSMSTNSPRAVCAIRQRALRKRGELPDDGDPAHDPTPNSARERDHAVST